MRTKSVPYLMADSNSDDARILFCPFCRECYEGELKCPVHELPLVEFVDLPKMAHERKLPGFEEDLEPWDARFGRGWIALGVVFGLVGFFMPFASAVVDDQEAVWSGFDLAAGPARTMWTIPFVLALYAWLLVRRRNIRAMRGARLVAIVLSFAPALSAGYAMVHMWRGIDELNGGGLLEWGLGIPVMAVGSVLLLLGAMRFGVLPRAGLPHGSAPDEPAASIGVEDPD